MSGFSERVSPAQHNQVTSGTFVLVMMSDIVYDNVIQRRRAERRDDTAKRAKKGRLQINRPSVARTRSVDPITAARVEFALSTLAVSGKLKGSRSERA